MASYEQGMGAAQSPSNPSDAAPESGLGRSENPSQTTETQGAPESGMGRDEGYRPGAEQQGMGRDEGYRTGAPEQGMGKDEGAGRDGGMVQNQSETEYGMGSGRASDQKEGSVGKFFDKVKGKFGRRGSKEADIR